MAKRLYDGGWFYVDLVSADDDSTSGLMRFRMWHPHFWMHFLRARFARRQEVR